MSGDYTTITDPSGCSFQDKVKPSDLGVVKHSTVLNKSGVSKI